MDGWLALSCQVKGEGGTRRGASPGLGETSQPSLNMDISLIFEVSDLKSSKGVDTFICREPCLKFVI